MATVRFDDVLEALEFVSGGPPDGHRAYISLDTGRVIWTGGDDQLEEDVPEDLETSDRYLAVPHKRELDLGRDLALRFVREELPDGVGVVREIFARRGAYRRFKDFLEERDCLDRWYAFEAQQTEQALRAWCVSQGIELSAIEKPPA